VPTYIDTSAVLRLVERRGDYSLAEVALRDSPTTSELATLECWASIHKRWHDGSIGLKIRFCTADSRQATAARGLFGVSEVDLLPPL
jgi:hypothetical protein